MSPCTIFVVFTYIYSIHTLLGNSAMATIRYHWYAIRMFLLLATHTIRFSHVFLVYVEKYGNDPPAS